MSRLILPDEGNQLVRQAPQQDAHAVPPLRQGGAAHPEEDLRAVRVPRGPHQGLQLVSCRGEEEDSCLVASVVAVEVLWRSEGCGSGGMETSRPLCYIT